MPDVIVIQATKTTEERTVELPILDNPLKRAYELFEGQLPENTLLTIEEQTVCKQHSYIFRCQYTSKSSGRKICVSAKGEELPTARDSLFMFYLRQLSLNPKELAMHFSKVYFLEKRARQEAFLQGDRSVMVSDTKARKDRLKYEDSAYADVYI